MPSRNSNGWLDDRVIMRVGDILPRLVGNFEGLGGTAVGGVALGQHPVVQHPMERTHLHALVGSLLRYGVMEYPRSVP